MSAIAVQEKIPPMPIPIVGTGKNGMLPLVSTDTFYKKYRHREDGWKYELVNGRIEKHERTMNDSQLHIATNLHRLFYTLLALDKVEGTFQAEKDTELWKDHVRRPDMCYLTEQQIAEAHGGGHPVAGFVIEVVSPTDNAEKYAEKIEDYFKAGVKVVWMIYPKARQVQVHVFDSPLITVCKEDMVCSAAPVLPAFALSADDIFKKPKLSK